jgi:hypothetical protein
VSLFILLDGDEGVVVIISQSRGLRIHVCKILIFCTLPKRFCGRCLRPLYSTRARLPAEPLSSRSVQGNQRIVPSLTREYLLAFVYKRSFISDT